MNRDWTRCLLHSDSDSRKSYFIWGSTSQHFALAFQGGFKTCSGWFHTARGFSATQSRCNTLLLHGPTQRRAHSEKEDIKNSDRNGPEGQFKATGSTMCNAGLSPWYPCFMIQVHPIKVSMKKKKRKRRKIWGRTPRTYRRHWWSVHACKFPAFHVLARD